MKKILILGGVFLAVIAVGLYKFGIFSAEENVRKAKNVPKIQAFKEIDLAFEHKAHEERFPFLGGAVIDVEGDGKMEIFISGSKGQNSALYSYQNGQLTDGPPPINESISGVNPDKIWIIYRRHINGKEALYG